jgi:hypothetical protein
MLFDEILLAERTHLRDMQERKHFSCSREQKPMQHQLYTSTTYSTQTFDKRALDFRKSQQPALFEVRGKYHLIHRR